MEKAFAPEGVYAAMVTPFDGLGHIDHNAVQDMMDFLAAHGADGVFPVSNVGEFLTLSQDEKLALIASATEATGGRIKVMPGVTELCIERALALCRAAKDAGADGVVLSTPYYYRHPQAYTMTYMQTIAEHSPLPVTLYHSPKFANPIGLDNLMTLLSHENITAVKESSGDIRFLMQLMERIRAENLDVNVLLGWEELLLSGLPYGVKGCVTSCGGIVPELLRKTIDSFRAGDMEMAAACERAVTRITNALTAYGFPQGYKMGVLARGLRFQIYQSPHMAAMEAELQCEVAGIHTLIETELSLLNRQP